MKPMEKVTVPAKQGRAFRLNAGQSITIETPKGSQAADFFAFNAENVGEWLSANHTWVTTFNVKPRQGDQLLSRFRRPMLEFEKDGAEGTHDMMIAACDQFRYEFFGHEGHHPSCSENLHLAMRRIGYQIDVVPQPVNFFTNTAVLEDGSFVSPPNTVAPGSFVTLKALMDVICVVSACPFDLPVDGWPINSDSGPSELVVSVQ